MDKLFNIQIMTPEHDLRIHYFPGHDAADRPSRVMLTNGEGSAQKTDPALDCDCACGPIKNPQKIVGTPVETPPSS